MEVHTRFIIAAILVAAAGGTTNAASIDFEDVTGINASSGKTLASATASGVTVDFTCGTTSCFAFEYGGATNAFAGQSGGGQPNNDRPVGGFGNGTTVGSIGLSDDGSGFSRTVPYNFVFSQSVDNLSMDVIDLEDNRSGTLSVYANDDFTSLITSVTLNFGNVTGSITNIGVTAVGIRSAIFSYGSDTGSAIDNISFAPTVPLPASLAFLLSGIAGGAILARRRA